ATPRTCPSSWRSHGSPPGAAAWRNCGPTSRPASTATWGRTDEAAATGRPDRPAGPGLGRGAPRAPRAGAALRLAPAPAPADLRDRSGGGPIEPAHRPPVLHPARHRGAVVRRRPLRQDRGDAPHRSAPPGGRRGSGQAAGGAPYRPPAEREPAAVPAAAPLDGGVPL